MQVFNTFFKIALRNIGAGIGYIIVFTIISITVSRTSTNSGTSDFASDKVKIAVIDRDDSALSQTLYDYIDSNHKIVSIPADEEKWADELFYHTVEYILVIDKGFGENFNSDSISDYMYSYEIPDSKSSYIVADQVESYLSNMKTYLNAGYELNEASLKTTAIMDKKTTVSILGKSTGMDTSPRIFFFSYLPYVMISVMILCLTPMLIAWNKPEIKSRTEISSMPLFKRQRQIILAAVVYTCIIYIFFAGLSYLIDTNNFFCLKTGILLINAFVFTLVCTALTFFLAQVSKNTNLLSMWSNVIGLSSSFLCGVFVQRSLLPDNVINFSKCLPAYWYINITEELKYYNGGKLNSIVYTSLIVQLLFALALFSVALVVIKAKRQKNA